MKRRYRKSAFVVLKIAAWIIFGAFFVIASQCQAQAIYANVTGTVVDPNTHPLAGAQLTPILVDTTGRQVTSATSPNGQIVSTTVKPIVLDATGGFTLQLLNTSTLSKPSGTQWKISILPPPLDTQAYILTFQPPWAIQYTTSITADIDLSSQLSALTSPINFINLQTGQNTISSGTGTDITLTNSGSSGAATLIGTTLNIPVYTPTSGGYLLTAPSGNQAVTTPSGNTLSFANIYSSETLADVGETYLAKVSNVNNTANESITSWVAHSTTMNCVGQGENLTGFWSTCNPQSTVFLSNTRGIMDGRSLKMTHNGQGDTFGGYDYYTFFGGNVQGDDEGLGGQKMQMHQIAWLSGTVSNGFTGSTQNYSPIPTGKTYVSALAVVPYTGPIGTLSICFPTGYSAPTAATAHIYFNNSSPGTSNFTPTTDVPLSVTATTGCQTFTSGTDFSPVSGTQGQNLSVYVASGSGPGHQSVAGYSISGTPTIGTAATYSSDYAPSIYLTMAAPARGSTSLIATGITQNGYHLAEAGIGFADGGTVIDETQGGATATLASQGTLPALGGSIYYNLASGSVTPSTAYGNIVSCTPSNSVGLTNQQTQSTSCLVNVTSSGAFTTASHIFLNGGYVGFGEEAAVTSVTALSGGQQTVVFQARGGDYSVMMQGGPGGQAMVQTSLIGSQPVAYWIIGAISSTQIVVSNCAQGSCNSLANIIPGSPTSTSMTISYGASMTRSSGTVTLTNVPTAVSYFPVGSTITVSGATPSDLNGTFTVATNSGDTIDNVSITWLQTGATESTTTNAAFTGPNTGVTFFPAAYVTGTLSGASGGLQVGVNNVNWALGDTIVGAPSNVYSATGLFIVQGQTTPVNGSYPTNGIVYQEDGPSPALAVLSATNYTGNAASSFITATGAYDSYLNFAWRPANNGCLLCVFGIEPFGGAQKPYYIFEDHNTGFGGILADIPNYKYVFSQPVVATAFTAIADPKLGGAANVLPGIVGDATAPTGSCATVGVWMFTQDGHATFCNGTTWATKI